MIAEHSLARDDWHRTKGAGCKHGPRMRALNHGCGLSSTATGCITNGNLSATRGSSRSSKYLLISRSTESFPMSFKKRSRPCVSCAYAYRDYQGRSVNVNYRHASHPMIQLAYTYGPTLLVCAVVRFAQSERQRGCASIRGREPSFARVPYPYLV